MKIKFDANQDFQLEAINAIVDVFDGQPLAQSDYEISFASEFMQTEQTELGVGNRLVLDQETLLKNVQAVQDKYYIENTDTLQGYEFIEEHTMPITPAIAGLGSAGSMYAGATGTEGTYTETKLVPNFSIEMETGTGKTYVYLRTIFELNRKYGFKKFIIVVPSIAIREGTLKNLDITKEHFQHIYNNVPFEYYVYDSKRVSQLRQFATSNQIQVLVINIDAFRKTLDGMDDDPNSNKLSNIIHRENDRLSGRKPIEFIQATNPIVIVDEPQSVDSTDKAREAIRTLNPLCTLRYSATHRDPYNLLYKLDPIKAYEMRIVKRIEVASVMSDGSFNDAFIRLDSVKRDKSGISAKVTIHVNQKDGTVKEKSLKVQAGSKNRPADDLSNRSNEREAYRDGYIVEEINTEEGFEYIRFSSGRELELGASQGGLTDEIMRVQIRDTIEEHLKKELQIKEQGIKVLSLFFIDRVANYRSYDELGNEVQGKFAKWFEESYEELTSKPRFKDLIPYPVESLHDGYFSVDKKGKAKDTKGNTQADENAYSLIMREKERLLSPEEPLRFIFSHSALREGWDNPNVFQICTLNVTKSEIKKRQEIGRGLRLPVNTNGVRVFNDNINKLTVIANESYKDFAKQLQTEIEDDFGVRFGVVSNIAFVNISQTIDGEVVQVSKEKSEKIWKELKDNGYIDKDGEITSKFNPKDPDFELVISSEHDDIKPAIIDTIKSHQFEGHIVDKKSRQPVRLKKEVLLDDDFKALWDRISQKTTYSVEYDTPKLIEQASEEIKRMDAIEAIKIQSIKAKVDIKKAGVETQEVLSKTTVADTSHKLPDVLAYLQKETELTRSTLAEILICSGRLGDFIKNPQLFIDNVTKYIKRKLHRFMIEGIKYEKIDGDMYEMRLFQEEILAYFHNLIEVKNSIYDYVEYDSEVERQFAKDLDNMEEVKLFVKLPSWFKVETPIGTYNPDWAIVKHGDDTLYLVRETKSTLDKDKLRKSENDKITCAEKHFYEIEVDFKVVAKARDI